MADFEINELFRAIVGGAWMINALLLWLKKRADFTFCGTNTRKKRIHRLRLAEGVAYTICFFLLCSSVCFLLYTLANTLNIKTKTVTGTVLSVEETTKERFFKKGVVLLQSQNRKEIKIRHVYYDTDEIVNQQCEILVIPSQVGDNILVKSNKEYTNFYKKHFQTPEAVREKSNRFLLFYTILSIGYSIWLMGKSRCAFRKEKDTICFMNFRKIKIMYFVWIIACVAYKLELVMLLLNTYQENIMVVCLPITYVIYKLGFFSYCAFRYYYIISEDDTLLVKNKWKNDERYSSESYVVEKQEHGPYLKIRFTNGKQGTISRDNILAQELVQKE